MQNGEHIIYYVYCTEHNTRIHQICLTKVEITTGNKGQVKRGGQREKRLKGEGEMLTTQPRCRRETWLNASVCIFSCHR